MLLLAVLASVSCMAGTAAATGPDRGFLVEDTVRTPAARRLPAGEPAESAAAAVLVATLAARFGERMRELRLYQVELETGDSRDQTVHGRGEILFAGGDEWLPFGFHVRYDPILASAGYPEIDLGGGGGGEDERHVPNDAALVAELEARVAVELESVHGSGRVHLQLDRIRSVMAGSRFLHIEATGIADSHGGGRTPAGMEGLYDLHARSWLDVGHVLVPDFRPRDDGGTAGP